MGIKQIKQIALRFREYTSFRLFFFFLFPSASEGSINIDNLKLAF